VASIVASAPGRCGILGNPSDMYGGCVISCTTMERAECRIETDASAMTVTNAGETATIASRTDLTLRGDKLDIARAALIHFKVDPATTHLTVELRTDVPMRAGLAGSTALLTAIVGALAQYTGLAVSRYHLAEITRKIEARIMKVVCGLQDQQMTVFGGLNFMDFHGKEQLEQRDDEPLATVEPLAPSCETPPLLLAHTGIEHHSGTVHSSPRERWLAGDTQVRGNYATLAHLARRGKRALVEKDWATLGALMNENHRLVSELGGSGDANDRLIRVAREAGAWGAKLAGAGGGGTIIILAADRESVGSALLAAGADCLLTPVPQPGLTVTRDG
jgi:galactokinase/mevalonate kinase-like predicted kinase